MSNKPFYVAISGKSGCGNTTVSTILAQRLGFRLVNYTFHSIAHETGVPFEEICRQAEEDPKWDHMVDHKQVKMARGKNSVLGSRLAVWLLREADLKVFLTASPEVRAERIVKREGGSLASKMEKTANRDTRDHRRYLKLYDIDNNRYDFVDIIINTDHFLPDQIADIIVAAVRTKLKEGE
jgi:cytidylate kinase